MDEFTRLYLGYYHSTLQENEYSATGLAEYSVLTTGLASLKVGKNIKLPNYHACSIKQIRDNNYV